MDEYKAIRQQSNDRNDCSVIAVSIATDISYEEAYELLAKAGRKPNKGLHSYVYHKVMEQMGFTVKRIRLKSKTVRTIERELARNWGGAKVLINIRRHVLAWNGEKIVDWSAGRKHLVREAFLVYKDVEPVCRSVPQPKQKPIGCKRTAVAVRCPDKGRHEWVEYPSLWKAWEAQNIPPKGHQRFRRYLKYHKFAKQPVREYDGNVYEIEFKVVE